MTITKHHNEEYELYDTALKHYQKGDKAKAAKYIIQATIKVPDDFFITSLYVVLFDELLGIDTATFAQKLIACFLEHIHPHDKHDCISALFTTADLCRDDDPESALKLYKQAIKTDPDYCAAHYNYGYQLIIMNRHDEALPHLIKAYNLNNKCIDTLIALGGVYFHFEDYKATIKTLQKVLSIDEKNAPAHSNLALCYSTIGHFHKEISILSDFIRLFPYDAIAHARLGLAYALSNKQSHARLYKQNAIKLMQEDEGEGEKVKELIEQIEEMI